MIRRLGAGLICLILIFAIVAGGLLLIMNNDATSDGIIQLGYKYPTGYHAELINIEQGVVAVQDVIYGPQDKLFGVTLKEQTLGESSEQDDMIYTEGTGITSNGTPVTLLYIGDPTTNDLIAASITYSDNNYWIYTFLDKNQTTIYDRLNNK